MTIGLVMIVKNEAQRLPRCLKSAIDLIDTWTIVDTGSDDGTQEVISDLLEDIPGTLHERPWINFSENLTEALELAADTADWQLRLDADMTVEWHDNFPTWLSTNPDPDTDAWMVEVQDHGDKYRLPLLTRTGEWEYKGVTHEWLDLAGRKSRPLLGLTVHHHADGSNRADKFVRDIALLEPGVQAGDSRSVFYTAECYRFLGDADRAIALYDRRAKMGGFEEEAWYASYQAAKLRKNVAALLKAWRDRPWRHEPLQAAARIVAEQRHDDMLFLESVG